MIVALLTDSFIHLIVHSFNDSCERAHPLQGLSSLFELGLDWHLRLGQQVGANLAYRQRDADRESGVKVELGRNRRHCIRGLRTLGNPVLQQGFEGSEYEDFREYSAEFGDTCIDQTTL